jgi:hypothetical protein
MDQTNQHVGVSRVNSLTIYICVTIACVGDLRMGCKSDADEQLILHIGFQEFVKLGVPERV